MCAMKEGSPHFRTQGGRRERQGAGDCGDKLRWRWEPSDIHQEMANAQLRGSKSQWLCLEWYVKGHQAQDSPLWWSWVRVGDGRGMGYPFGVTERICRPQQKENQDGEGGRTQHSSSTQPPFHIVCHPLNWGCLDRRRGLFVHDVDLEGQEKNPVLVSGTIPKRISTIHHLIAHVALLLSLIVSFTTKKWTSNQKYRAEMWERSAHGAVKRSWRFETEQTS